MSEVPAKYDSPTVPDHNSHKEPLLKTLSALFRREKKAMPSTDQLTATYKAEATRGLRSLLILSFLPAHHYGYELRSALALCGFDLDDATLYPALHQLEIDGLLRSTKVEHPSVPTSGDPNPNPHIRHRFDVTPAGEEVCDRLALAIIHPLVGLPADAEARTKTTIDEDWLRHYRDYPLDALGNEHIIKYLNSLPPDSRISVRGLLDGAFPGANLHGHLLPFVWRLMATHQLSYNAEHSNGAASEDTVVWLPSASTLTEEGAS